jgi:GntR family transcriptional regulator, transcriptional repressor for pyruvate dehydrogenase complex
MSARGSQSDVSKALFVQVQRDRRLSDKVADMMLDTIVSRRLNVGDRLPSERELGEQFGVSRTVVREAVRALVAKGLIEVRSGSGLRVAAVNAATVSESMSLYLMGGEFDFEQVHEVRKMLEVHIAGVAADRATDEDVQALEEACDRMETALEDVEQAAQLDVEFHRLIAHATQNDLYLVLLDSIGKPQLEIRRSNIGAGHGPETLRQHRAILARIAAGDPEAAGTAMAKHLDTVERFWQRSHPPPRARKARVTA